MLDNLKFLEDQILMMLIGAYSSPEEKESFCPDEQVENNRPDTPQRRRELKQERRRIIGILLSAVSFMLGIALLYFSSCSPKASYKKSQENEQQYYLLQGQTDAAFVVPNEFF